MRLVQMEMDDKSWHLVRSIPDSLGFIGGKSNHPLPITEAEARRKFSIERLQSRKVCSRQRCLDLVSSLGLLTVHLLTLMVWLKKLIKRKAVWLSLF